MARSYGVSWHHLIPSSTHPTGHFVSIARWKINPISSHASVNGASIYINGKEKYIFLSSIYIFLQEKYMFPFPIYVFPAGDYVFLRKN